MYIYIYIYIYMMNPPRAQHGLGARAPSEVDSALARTGVGAVRGIPARRAELQRSSWSDFCKIGNDLGPRRRR